MSGVIVEKHYALNQLCRLSDIYAQMALADDLEYGFTTRLDNTRQRIADTIRSIEAQKHMYVSIDPHFLAWGFYQEEQAK